ncbi:putative wall-associated receptor kinase-like 11 [Triticum dicoccoides]|uniref:putative wall-associated receptor kinase-like 11 n=1 Tax=Triticum dicoccoides TaxID=85692 RepID=UPI000E79FEAC|nr:putative wall-associated receptor kinase-like 11 [Triticum dicoccoides]
MTISIPSSRRASIGTIGALVFQLLVVALAAGPIALPGCPESCGHIIVPYPFGISKGCFHEGFGLTCDEMQYPPRLFLGDGVEVLGISLTDGTVRIRSKVLRSSFSEFNGSWSGPAVTWPFSVSSAWNWFVAIGCNIVAKLGHPSGLHTQDGSQASTCAAACLDDHQNFTGTSCSGIGHCRASIVWELASYGIQVTPLAALTPDFSSYTGVYVFIVDQDWFSRNENEMMVNFTHSYEKTMVESVPAVLEWWLDLIGNKDMLPLSVGPNSSEFRCLSLNSDSYFVFGDYEKRRCNCSQGYEGNPYITDGCQDINECLQPDVYPCNGTCINMPGTYQCSAKKRIITLPGLITIIAVGAGFGLLFSLLGVAQVTKTLKKQRAKKLRQKFFEKNHGLLLQQLISSNKDIAEKMKIFSLEELEQATNKFDHNRILGGGGHGTVYKGILSDQRVVAIKKANIVVQREIDQFLNEVVILSQTNHRNVVKLFGCCLETEVPLLVYEFISNETLSCHLHGQSDNHLSWKDRLRIALETARAIAYLHSAASISVYHRDIKCANILLTDTLTAKVSDFGASRSIAIDETGILTAIQGTYGYLDPEYYYTSRLTEKSDVYSFGVILAELLTRITPVFSSHSSEGTSLASHFVSLMSDNRLSDILDTQIVNEGGVEDAEVVARLAKACLSLKGEERPTMRQVETILEGVHSSRFDHNSQTIRVGQSALKDQPWKGNNGGEGTRLYSLEKEFIESSEIPR